MIHIALLRAVNVGGTGKLAMAELARICSAAGFRDVRTVLTSGNALFHSDASAEDVRGAIEAGLLNLMGRPVPVLMRSAAEIEDVLARNPFPHAPGDRVAVLFLDGEAPPDPSQSMKGLSNEEIVSGKRELFIHYPDGIGRSRLKFVGAEDSTARNINTVAKLAALAAAMS